MSKIEPTVRDPFMDACDNRLGVPLSVFESFLCAFASAFSSVRKNRDSCSSLRSISSKGFETCIDPDHGIFLSCRSGFILDRETGIPFPGCRPPNRKSLDITFDRAMKNDRDVSNL